MSDEFEGAIDEAKRLEKKVMEYAPYQGEMDVVPTIDFEPKEYVDITYQNLLNVYERNQKIISTVSMGLLAKEGTEAPPTAESSEVETKLLEMRTETLKQAEEVGKEPIAIEKISPAPEEAPKPEVHEIKLEFETKPANEPEIEKEKPLIMEEKPEEKEEKPEEAAEPKVEVPQPEKKVVVAAVPPALRQSSDQLASTRFERMEEQVRATIGEKADEVTIKKKMLELTKNLFKEKSTSKREEIKLQIATLKNMLVAGPSPAKPAMKGEKKDETHQKLYDTILSTHQSELAQTKDTIIDSYNKQISAIKKKFYEDVSSTEDSAKRKQIFEGFVFSVTSLVEQLPEVLNKYQDFTAKKHQSELEKLRDSLGPDEKGLRGTVEGRLDYLKNNYAAEFASVKGIVAKEIDNLIEVAGADIFKKPEEKPKESEAAAYEAIKEINDTDEGTLLYFLHSKDPDYYKKYERKQLSKAEAIFKAKELMAKDKGLSEALVKKYFSQVE